jgi:hypothetical protein
MYDLLRGVLFQSNTTKTLIVREKDSGDVILKSLQQQTENWIKEGASVRFVVC